MGNGSATCGRFRWLARITTATALLALLTPAAAQSRVRDRDHDGLSDRYELKKSHTGIRRADSDRDRLKDGYEVRKSNTNPHRADTDRDGLSDSFELRRARTNPRKRDTDRDGVSDGTELLAGRNPKKPDRPPALNTAPVGPFTVPDVPDPLPDVPDLLPPDTTITTGPTGTVANGTASFSFASTEANSTFECRLDGSAWSTCESPEAYAGLADGVHTFSVRATDESGNTDLTPATRSWTVEVPPADTTAPDTSISDGPSGTTQSTSASFGFASSESGSTFECRLDGGTWDSCTSPQTYSGLSVGSHTFRVRATDAAGNTDASPASRTWSITDPDPGDTTAPDTSISSGPTATETTRAANFAFSSTEAGSSFECRLDGGAWAACSSPKAYSGVADGSHTFNVRAIDGAGNTDATPASRTWTVDATAPNTTIGSGPTGSVSTASASFGFSSSETGSTFECRIDGGAYATCTSPKAYSGLADGSHTFNVRATDAAGNADGSPAARTWTVDTAAPDTAITSGPSGTSTSASASFGFSSTETGSTFQCRIDSGAWGACTSPKSYSSLANGSHTFDVRAADGAGNQDGSPATRSWIVATTDPDPDPSTNCMDDPSACGFPDVESTGVLPGVARTTVNGDVTLSTAGQVYENKTVNGTISVTAANVTIRNVKLVVPRGESYGIQAFGWNTGVKNLVMEDSEIDMNLNYNSKGIAFDQYTLRRVFIHNGSDCAHAEHSVVIEDSLCALGPDSNSDAWPDNESWCDGPEHRDGFQSDGGDGLTFRHNTIRNNCGETSSILMSTNTSPIKNVTIVDNLMAGGGYTLYCNAGPDVPNETVTGNRLSRVFYAQGGYWGPLTGCSQADTYSGNVWDETGSTLAAG
jgi:hypothetical protein